MERKPVRRPSDGRVRVYGLGWVKPQTAAVLVVITVVLFILVFGFGI